MGRTTITMEKLETLMISKKGVFDAGSVDVGVQQIRSSSSMQFILS